jgi:hypothetical protein
MLAFRERIVDRQLKTAEEIRSEVIRLVHERITAIGGLDLTSIGHPWQRPAPDQDGCNWYVAYFTKAKTHIPVITSVVADVKRRWNLK